MTSKYSIKDLEKLSGIKAHTIRIWEQRYQLIQPKRTPTNIRYYEDCDLRKLLNVSFLVHEGIKISQVSKLDEGQLKDLVLEKSNKKGEFIADINALKMAMFEYDQDEFSKAFDSCIEKYGAEKTFTDVLGEFIGEIGVLWQTNTVSVSHEHFVSNLVKQKIYTAIDGIRTKISANAKTYLLYLPANELHEIGLLYLQWYLRNRGDVVVFLGQNTPSDYILEVFNKTPFDELISVFTASPHMSEVEDYLKDLELKLNDLPVKIRICGAQLSELLDKGIASDRISLFKNVAELRQNLHLSKT